MQLIQVESRERHIDADVNPDPAMNHARKVVGTVICAARQAGIHVVHECGSNNVTILGD